MRRRLGAVLCGILLASTIRAGDDPLRPPANGPRRIDPGVHALVGATVHLRPGEAFEGATVVLRDGEIAAVGAVEPPAGARIWNLDGFHVYAGFIDPYVAVDAPMPDRGAPGAHWSPKVTPQRSVLDGKGLDEDAKKKLREMGFTAAVLAPKGGILRGRASLVSLAETDPRPGSARPTVLREDIYHAVGFDTGGEGVNKYPSSLMGAIALIRQTLSDVDWLRGSPPESPGALDALLPVTGVPGPDVYTPLLFDCGDELTTLRATRLAGWPGWWPAILLGSGLEFRRLEAVRLTGLPVVTPLAYPKKPKVASVGDAEAIDLREMMTWEQAPTNARRLDAAGVQVALTTARLEDRGKFPERLREAIRHGLDRERALAMLTVNPAKILGMEARLGTIEPHKIANLVVADGDVFDEDTRVRWVFVDGRPHPVMPVRLRGVWSVTLEPPIEDEVTLTFRGDDDLEIRSGDDTGAAETVEVADRSVKIVFDHGPFGDPGRMMLSGEAVGKDRIEGVGERPDGKRFRWTATRTSRKPPEKKDDDDRDDDRERPVDDVPEAWGLPFGPYGVNPEERGPSLVVVRGGTIWTCGPQGVIEDGILATLGGKVLYLGTDADELGRMLATRRIASRHDLDARGKHVTPGVIDCHSHTGLSGDLNESGQAVSAEVRIADVTNPDDVNWYRQLAGGVTAVLSLHGSANPIGGQSQVHRLRWGVVSPEQMHFEGAKPGIKFALGENVKQSNWGDKHTTRYPQTRMGVETLMRDRFVAAREYAARKKKREDSGVGEIPRPDLELDALAEVLAGERLIHCHAYRQDEILMLCRLAEEFGFTVGTFQHVLEGYKVADVMAKHGAGGSCFSDWWAYKVEVQDAIPFNGTLMHRVGVLTSFNSDSSELARRLNVEAAKAVKYGGLAPEEALKLVTLFPAKQLRIDDRVGSLEVGKDADFAVWSGDPLSTTSRCVSTWVEGRERFSLERDARHRAWIAKERQRLIQKILASPDEDGRDEKGKGDKPYSCCHEAEGGGR